MTGISDQFVTIGAEAVAWGTVAATLTRGIEHQPGSNPTHRVERAGGNGFRPGFKGQPEASTVTTYRGGSFPLQFDLMSVSHSMVLASAGSVAITTPGGATTARLHTITPSAYALPSRSFQRAVALSDGTIDYINYLGGKCVDLGFSVSPKGNVMVKANYDTKAVNTAASGVTPSYPASPYVYRDTDVTTTLGGTAVCQHSIDLTIPTLAKIDRDMVCPGGRDEPVVVGRPVPTGTLNVDPASFGYLDDWFAGTSRELVITINGGADSIETGFDNEVVITFPAVKFTGDEAAMSLTDLTTQGLPWEAFDNGTDPVWTITYQTTDTAI